MNGWTKAAVTALIFAISPMTAQADTIASTASYSHNQQWHVSWVGNLNGCDPALLETASGSGTVALIVKVDGAIHAARTTSTWASPDSVGLSLSGAGAGSLPYGSLNGVTHQGADFLTCGPHTLLLPSSPEPVPTLSEWALILLGLLFASGAALMLQRRKTA